MKLYYSQLALSLCFVLSACGGGGGANDGGGGSTDVSSLYQGVDTSAAITIDNLGLFASSVNVLIQDDTISLPSQNQAVRTQLSARASIDETLFCSSGSASVKGNIDENKLTGVLEFKFDSCDLEGEGNIYDGAYKVDVSRVNPNDFSPIDTNTSFSSFRIKTSDNNYTELNGNLKNEGLGTCDTKVVQNLVVTSSIQDLNVYTDELTLNRTCANLPDTSLSFDNASVSGRVYLAEHGFVDVSSQNLLIARFVYSGHEIGGRADVYAEGSLSFDSDSSRLSFESSTSSVLDINKYDTRVTLLDKESNLLSIDVSMPSWMANITEVLELDDTDSDGMWDGYEHLYGLNHLLDDSSDDLDEDGYSNGLEFQLFTAPNDENDRPAAAIRLGLLNLPDTVYVGQEVDMQIEMIASFEQRFAEIIGDFSISAEVDLQSGLWVVDSDYGCILNGNELRCDNISAPALAAGSLNGNEVSILGSIHWVPDAEESGCINFSYSADYKIDLESSGGCSYVY
ncbi:hypothetical protein F9L16_03985 [Agarivorans sp. B2Z047]|uniref:hypothetical protein n=1 Tax=Agarivorans sp. B2Z047 TaxID=2652721 RepID=UPI00128DAF1C|nr:hypothetical protein [Agarivorans sp. B2Z047]MPW28156.1 hypothetical protein [Agarivorans sp. B2Z047]UQN44013.1 hypothetical protein LQZ07_05945 [Agarivorans sp. B2Z047]